jgi:Protein of unknown function (DUF3800)
VLGQLGSGNSKADLESPASWEIFPGRPRSLSGVKIEQDRLVRFIYVDETGISINESITLVAGVIIDADKQWKDVEKAIADLVDEYVPEEHRDGFVFHAKDLYSGAKVFDRSKYPIERAFEALRKLVSIPGRMRLPVVYGFIKKDPSTAKTRRQRRLEAASNHSYAFSLCMIAAELYMKDYADPSEIATVIAENNTETRDIIKSFHALLRGQHRSGLSSSIFAFLSQYGGDCLPIKRIIDTVHFADKNEAILLQLADACALIIRYFLEGKPNAEQFFDALTGGETEVIYGRDDPAGYAVLVPKFA